eukprot:5683373-Prymnesium_polylepis.2
MIPRHDLYTGSVAGGGWKSVSARVSPHKNPPAGRPLERASSENLQLLSSARKSSFGVGRHKGQNFGEPGLHGYTAVESAPHADRSSYYCGSLYSFARAAKKSHLTARRDLPSPVSALAFADKCYCSGPHMSSVGELACGNHLK